MDDDQDGDKPPAAMEDGDQPPAAMDDGSDQGGDQPQPINATTSHNPHQYEFSNCNTAIPHTQQTTHCGADVTRTLTHDAVEWVFLFGIVRLRTNATSRMLSLPRSDCYIDSSHTQPQLPKSN